MPLQHAGLVQGALTALKERRQPAIALVDPHVPQRVGVQQGLHGRDVPALLDGGGDPAVEGLDELQVGLLVFGVPGGVVVDPAAATHLGTSRFRSAPAGYARRWCCSGP
jgi:hypothetical protein